jgi:integral membrane protein (TIGR01906 family)
MSRIVRLIATVTVPLLLVLANVALLARGPFIAWEYGRSGFPAASGMTDDERLSLSKPSARFIVDNADVETLRRMTVGGEALYTEPEVQHVVDVRVLVRRLALLTLAGVVVVGAAAIAWRGNRPRVRSLLAAIGRGGWLTVGLVVLVGIGIALAWPFVFVGFHVVFFEPGTWSFPTDSGLIRLYPEQFWFDTAVALASLTLLEGALVGIVGRWLGR